MTVSFEQLLAGLEKVRQTGDGQWTACCPAHDDKHPSLSIALGNVAPVVLFCQTRRCTFKDIVEALELRGLWPVEVTRAKQRGNRLSAAVKRDITQSMARIDAQLKPIANTRADRYLTGRGITVRSATELAYHPSLFHPWSETTWPAMVAIVRNVAGEVVDFHRTWLSIAEPIVKAPIDPPRAWLGSITGHAVHLALAAETLLIGEGIETTLSAMQLYGLPGWAAMTAGNLVKVKLPPIVREVIFAADNDKSGGGVAAATKAAQRFRREGLQVRVMMPDVLNDFNDLLLLWQREGIDERDQPSWHGGSRGRRGR
jgi:putative DNA primase/helicase